MFTDKPPTILFLAHAIPQKVSIVLMPKRLTFHIPETRYEQELAISSLALQGIDSDFFLDEKPFLAKLAKKAM